MKTNQSLRKNILASLFLALAFIIPFFFGHVPEINSMFCPMHIPIFLCGLICGWQRGMIVGFLAPMLRSLLFGLPVFFPTALCMSFELAAYGAVAGLMLALLPKKPIFIYPSLLTAMLAGRILRGLATFICYGISGTAFSLSGFISGVVIYSIPGIILHLVLIPPCVMLVQKLNITKENH